MKTVFQKSMPGRQAAVPSPPAQGCGRVHPKELLRPEKPALPELSELDVVRHYTALSKLNFGVDGNFYPLGSCTMKYNPRINERVAPVSRASRDIHPLQSDGPGPGRGALYARRSWW